MPALFVSAELKEYPPKAPLFGSRTFISLCNLRNWAVCGYPFPSMLSRQSASWGSSHLLDSISAPPSPHPLAISDNYGFVGNPEIGSRQPHIEKLADNECEIPIS